MIVAFMDMKKWIRNYGLWQLLYNHYCTENLQLLAGANLFVTGLPVKLSFNILVKTFTFKVKVF